MILILDWFAPYHLLLGKGFPKLKPNSLLIPFKGKHQHLADSMEDAVASVDVENLNHPKEWCRSSSINPWGRRFLIT